MSTSKNKQIKQVTPKKFNLCKNNIPRREYLNCSQCKLTLDLGCANVPFVRFNLMDADRKKKWKCDKCLSKPQHNSPPIIQPASSSPYRDEICMQHENITTRQRKKPRASSVELLDRSSIESIVENCSTLTGDTRRSLPDLTTEDTKELQYEINTLKTKLASAHLEIDRLSMQVTELQKKIDEQQRNNKVLKQLVSESPTRKSTLLKQKLRISPNTSTPQREMNPFANEKSCTKPHAGFPIPSFTQTFERRRTSDSSRSKLNDTNESINTTSR